MAQKPRQLAIRFSLRINSRLAEIWRWNAERYGDAHATQYVELLRNQTLALRSEYAKGRVVPKSHSYRYLTLKKRSRGHGYVVVYQILEAEVYIIYYFHTAQDWVIQLKTMLREE